MAIRDILHYPDPRLRNRAEPVERVDDEVRRLLDDMLETMYAAPGIGLAAIQVNVPRRAITIDISERSDQPLCLVNPEIVELAGSVETEEGCLSVPGIYELVQRADWIRARGLDRDGQSVEFEAEGLLAVCVQHEIDHLSQLKRQRIRKKAHKQLRQAM